MFRHIALNIAAPSPLLPPSQHRRYFCNMIQFAIRTYYSSRPVMGDWKYYSGRVLFQKNFHHRWIRYHTPRPLSTKSDTMDFTSDHYWYLRQFNFLYNHNINNDNDATLDENNDNDRNSTMCSLGTTTCNVVGLKYDTVMVYPGERVMLIREPDNPLDSNAIRVQNQWNKSLGYIEATMAAKLSKVMEKLPSETSSTITMEATIASEGATLYSVPLTIAFYGESDPNRNRWTPREKLIISLIPTSPPREITQSSLGFSRVEVTKEKICWENAQKELDEVFDQLVDDQLKNLPPILIPSTIKTPLLTHQVDGIRWLCQNEIKKDEYVMYQHQEIPKTMSVPFYQRIQEGGKIVWMSEITKEVQSNPPEPIGGSILADDMGLGKSIQALGLIVTNSPKDANVPRTTLIVCPTSVMSSWVKQIEQHLEAGTLKVSQYHGPDRFNLLSKLDDVDVLVTSYGTMKSDFTRFLSRAATDHNCGVPKPESYLFDKRFHRIILDEAHMIRNVKSQAFKGVMALQASHRLCLTGTPIQNKPEDIYALLAFVAGGPLSDQKIFDEAIATPIYFGNPIGLSRLRTVMAHVALRRNKSELALPPKTVELRVVKYPDNCPHKYVHDVLFKSTQMKVRATLSTSTEIVVQKEKMEMLEAIMRVRQACVSGVLVPKTMEHLHVKGKNIRENETKLSMIEMNEYLGPSPKFKALHQAICEMNSDEKGVIFSQFTKVLDLLEPFLQSFGHSYVRLDGSMSLLQRNKSIQEFNAEIGGPRLILCSLRAAGTGITLTRGNHCFMMDPWWNSGVEQQAMDRIHRIGQKRDVRVIRFIMKGSIEEKMLHLQEAKAAIGKGSMEKLKLDEARKTRLCDYKDLFSMK